LRDRYEAVADDVYRRRGLTPISERGRRLKLSKLKNYELIEVEGKIGTEDTRPEMSELRHP
jgi:hypothetical protein